MSNEAGRAPGHPSGRSRAHSHGRLPDWCTAMALSYALGREAAGPAPHEAVPLDEAAGCILAEELRTPLPVPHYPSSAMDGFAYAAHEPAGTPPTTREAASGEPTPGEWVLEDWTGSEHSLAPGRACPVVTGRAVPHGATGIIRSEYAQVSDSAHTGPTPTAGDSAPDRTLALAPGAPLSELEPGRHIRPAGGEAPSGALIAPAGTALTPPLLAMAAICGRDSVLVASPPRVSLLYTGDEVVASGLPVRGTVRDAFSVQLPHLLSLAGADILDAVRIGDDAATTRDALSHMLASGTDMIVTTGGTGRSAADHIRAELTALAQETGGRIVFPELDMRPGHPTLLAALRTAEGRLVPALGLPGNPLAAMAAMRVAGRALLRGMRGLPPEVLLTVPLGVDSPAQKAERLVPAVPDNPRSEHFVSDSGAESDGKRSLGCRSAQDEPAWEPCTHAGPNMMRGLTCAEGWIVLPSRAVRAGERVPFLPLEW
ncbi:molybdopterin molybdotransferase MoeA [Brevibacterium album]|uniref:molybdopterin molybdotransferase MoeA n=1 Tax=Brevibacterium album TaxID=417948 RepID=UPI00041B46DB|nr:molybdopterin molybdotransferase MoeA [Brevibacterium album]